MKDVFHPIRIDLVHDSGIGAATAVRSVTIHRQGTGGTRPVAAAASEPVDDL